MRKYNELQKAHYSRQYSGFEKIKPPEEEDLFGWCKWYPLRVIEGFVSTLRGQSILVICCGAGRELPLFEKYGVHVTATDLTVGHLEPLRAKGTIDTIEVQDAQRLTFDDDSFDYGFVNAGLHHLVYPHAGLTELLRCSRKGVIFIESQDSVLHTVTRRLGRYHADFEPAGNYVYRWKKREVEKMCLSAHLHSLAIKTAFLPIVHKMMAGCKGTRMRTLKILLNFGNWLLAPVGNVFIAILFKQAPTRDQHAYVRNQAYKYKVL